MIDLERFPGHRRTSDHGSPDSASAHGSARRRLTVAIAPAFHALGLLLVCGCVAAPPGAPLPLTNAPPLSSNDGLATPDRWWLSFDDPVLAAHIEEGLRSNFTLRAAFERLRAARAVSARAEAPLRPTLDATAGGILRDGDDDPPADQFDLGLEASYELDLWGRVRSSAEVERLAAIATAEDLQVAAVSLSAEIALALYRTTESVAQLALIDSQLETNRNVLRVLENRFAIGQSRSADVLRQRQLVEATVEQRIVEAANRDLLEHQLAVLRGTPPQGPGPTAENGEATAEFEPPARLPTLASLPAVGLPAELLERRPDIRAALARLASADASVAVAVKDRYPRIDLAAAIGTAGEKPSDLFGSWIGSLAAQIVAPLFDGGSRRQEVERAAAERGERLAEYGDAVLVAFREVEDALALERAQTDRIASLESQLALANSTVRELRNQYLNGAADFIDGLTAFRDQQTLERDLLAARLFRIESRIALHRAIAGGFVDDSAESEPDHETTLREREDRFAPEGNP